MSNKIIMFDSPEAATYRTDIKGWVSSDGRFYGGDERTARWGGCTHQICKCGKLHDKHRTICDSCYAKQRTEKYYALPVEKWDGETPLCLWDDDRFFFDEGSLLDWLADQEEGTEVQLVKCKPGRLHYVDEDIWCDDLPEDGELPEEVASKLAELNEAIKRAEPVCWWPTNIRIEVEPFWEQLKTDHIRASD